MKKIIGVSGILIFLLGLCWGISRSTEFQFFGSLISRIETSDKVIALTFDDGPTKGKTDQILSILNKADVKATFFLVGSAIADNIQEARKIVKNGHEIGNHSYSHSRMVFKSFGNIVEEIEKTNMLIAQAGYNNKVHFRPPYGKKLFTLPYYLYKNDVTTVTWDIAPESAVDNNASTEEIAEYVINNVKPGSIILLHIMFESRVKSMAAVPKIIEELKADGYRFVTVSELISSVGK